MFGERSPETAVGVLRNLPRHGGPACPLPHGNWAATVHHGMCPGLYQPSLRSEGYLAFLGRISPEKRPDRAVAIAAAAGQTLRVAAKGDAADRAYFDEMIAALFLQPHVEFIGEIGDSGKSSSWAAPMRFSFRSTGLSRSAW